MQSSQINVLEPRHCAVAAQGGTQDVVRELVHQAEVHARAFPHSIDEALRLQRRCRRQAVIELQHTEYMRFKKGADSLQR